MERMIQSVQDSLSVYGLEKKLSASEIESFLQKGWNFNRIFDEALIR